jgi:hypothetical protein
MIADIMRQTPDVMGSLPVEEALRASERNWRWLGNGRA